MASEGKQEASMMEVDSKAGKKDELMPWVEKYRPSTLEDVLSNQDVISIFQLMV